MSRTFWLLVGAVGGVVVYRKGTQTANRAKELGPLGSAQVAASATGRLAGRTATGLGRLQDLKARREGKLLTGTAEQIAAEPVPVGWVPVDSSGIAPGSGGPSSGGGSATSATPGSAAGPSPRHGAGDVPR